MLPNILYTRGACLPGILALLTGLRFSSRNPVYRAGSGVQQPGTAGLSGVRLMIRWKECGQSFPADFPSWGNFRQRTASACNKSAFCFPRWEEEQPILRIIIPDIRIIRNIEFGSQLIFSFLPSASVKIKITGRECIFLRGWFE